MDRDPPWGRRAEDRISTRIYLEMMMRDVDRRLDKMDSAFEKLVDSREELLTKDWYEERHDPLEERIRSMELWRSNIMGRAIAIGLTGGVIIATVTAEIVHLIPK